MNKIELYSDVNTLSKVYDALELSMTREESAVAVIAMLDAGIYFLEAREVSVD